VGELLKRKEKRNVIMNYTIKAYRNGGVFPNILNLGTRNDQFHAPFTLTPSEKLPSTYWIGGYVDPRSGVDAVEKRKVPYLCRESNPPPTALSSSRITPEERAPCIH
jgi:hypothetical protein